ncbi:ABC transporter permease [Flexithrix dorotheae]|uniref:ABC transporter permease n=1 Tax=Flexithrix dorotheae TaxID=70993 RepID=UPI00036BB4FD|nr:ABC transporter permease [Flexithrix dorotheae]
MIKNYIKIAIRTLLKNKFYSLLNITGLAVGITCCLLIFLYVNDELSYDNYNVKGDQIYRLAVHGKFGGNDFHIPQMNAPGGPTMVNEFPEVLEATRIRKRGSYLVKYETKDGRVKSFKEEGVAFVDSNFFSVFSVPLLQGNSKTALKEPNTMVISKKMAAKYFEDGEDPIDKTLRLNNHEDYRITGVFEIPKNSHFHFEMMLSMEGWEDSKSDTWMSFNYFTYLVLRKDATPEGVNAKFPALIEKYIGPEIERFVGVSMAEFIESGNAMGFYLQPLKDIHLKSDLMDELDANGDITYVYIFSAIAFLILVIACINFMNLSTARSANRAKEVGVRKVLGSYRKQLIYQFLAESIILSMIAFAMSALLVPLLIDPFNDLAAKELEISYLTDWWLLLVMLLGAIIVGLMAGSYPAFFLSAFRPAQVLKGKLSTGAKSGWLRSTLVVFQFFASIFLIVGTMVVFNQLGYVQNKKLGFNKDQILILEDAYVINDDKILSFKNEMLRNPDITNASITGFTPIRGYQNNNAYFPGDSPSENDQTTVVSECYVDFDYIKTFGIEVLEGRDFSLDYGTDSSKAIVNEALVKHFGWENPIGEHLGTFTSDEGEFEVMEVIGVVQNFHFESLRENIRPQVLRIGQSTGKVAFSFNAQNTKKVLDDLKSKWDQFATGQPFSYSFMDETFEQDYLAERRVGELFGVFAGLAIFIACLGLLGLAAFTAEQRTKEIGVRKVLGASISGIIILLSKEFIKLILIAFVLAIPLSWYVMNLWLEDFAYKTTINPLIFVFAGLLTFFIAWFTMGFQSIKAARVNPVKSLRSE